MYGVDCKEQPSQESWPDLLEDSCTQAHVEIAHDCMQEQIDQMVAHRLQAMQHVVEPEGGHAEGTIRLVAGVEMEWVPPEIIPQEVRPGRCRENILVLQHSHLIIKAESTVKGVEGMDNGYSSTESSS